MVYFIGAGPGAADLITVRGQNLLKKADVVIWAGSLVNEELLERQRAMADSAKREEERPSASEQSAASSNPCAGGAR